MCQSPLLLIDNENIARRAFHASYHGPDDPGMSFDGHPTGAIHMWARIITDMAKRFCPQRVIFCLEGACTRRRAIYPGYKASRGEKPEPFLKQSRLIDGLIAGSGHEFLQFPEEEADDTIGSAAAHFSKEYDVVIASGDKDFAQCVSPRVRLARPYPKGVWEVYDPARVENEFGVRPDQFALLLALKGDTIDDVPGFGGIGEKYAPQMIVGTTTLDEVAARTAQKKKMPVDEARRRIDFSLSLTRLFLDLDASCPKRIPADREHPDVKRILDLRCRRAVDLLFGLNLVGNANGYRAAYSESTQGELFG